VDQRTGVSSSAGADVDYYYFYVSTLSDVTIHYRNDSWDYGRRRVLYLSATNHHDGSDS